MTRADTAVKVITAEQIREVLVEIVAEDPDHLDPRSADEIRPRYCGADGANCLVGKILSRLGFPDQLLVQLDNEFPLGELLSSGVRISESRNPALERIEPKAMALLAYLQDGQDAGLPWIDVFYYAYAKPSRLIPIKYVRERRPWLF